MYNIHHLFILSHGLNHAWAVDIKKDISLA